jgi:hypothetical protein
LTFNDFATSWYSIEEITTGTGTTEILISKTQKRKAAFCDANTKPVGFHSKKSFGVAVTHHVDAAPLTERKTDAVIALTRILVLYRANALPTCLGFSKKMMRLRNNDFAW